MSFLFFFEVFKIWELFQFFDFLKRDILGVLVEKSFLFFFQKN